MKPSNLDWPRLRALAESEFRLSPWSAHGPGHWRRVEANAVAIAQSLGADEDICRLFAIFHDVQREDDYTDPEHGRRAAKWIETIHGPGKAFDIGPERAKILVEAIRLHADGQTVYAKEHPEIAACWDADRLDLWRVSTPPDPKLLSSAKAFEMMRDPTPREIELPRFIYHGTSSVFLKEIKSDGLSPRSVNGYRDASVTHEDFVYLSSAYGNQGPMFYAANSARLHGGAPLLVKIEMGALNPSNFYPDHNYVWRLLVDKGATRPANVHNPPPDHDQWIRNALNWGRENQESNQEFWSNGFSDYSSHCICHRGTVPPEAICATIPLSNSAKWLASENKKEFFPDLELHIEKMDAVFEKHCQPF